MLLYVCIYWVPRPHKSLVGILSSVVKIGWLLVHPTPFFYCFFNCRKFVLTIKLAPVISLMSTSRTHEQIEQQSCRVEAPIHSKFGSNNNIWHPLDGEIFAYHDSSRGHFAQCQSGPNTKNSCDFPHLLYCLGRPRQLGISLVFSLVYRQHKFLKCPAKLLDNSFWGLVTCN